MIRPVFTELALFITPFVLYAIFLWATRADILHPDQWRLPTLLWLTIAALSLIVISFVFFAELTGAPPKSTYIPAHMENGKFVPGETK
jgi:hypothetical protein